MKTVIIKSLNNGSSDIIREVPDDFPAYKVVETWQKKQTSYLIRQELEPVSWKVAETNDFIKCMIESAKM